MRSLILVEGKIDEKPVTFLLDTGSNNTIISTKAYGHMEFFLRRAQRNHDAAGMSGEAVRLPVNLTLANHVWVGQRVSVMNLDELQGALGVHFDGLLGEDILREFHSMRIDYRGNIVELE
jgi:predicted aspartyl protease